MQVLSGFRPFSCGQQKPTSQAFEANLRRLQRDAALQNQRAVEIPENFVPGVDYRPGSFANFMGV